MEKTFTSREPRSPKLETWGEEKFYNILIDYEISSMVKDVQSQVWVKTMSGRRRIDFILVISDDPEYPKKLYIEIDGSFHNEPSQRKRDRIREREIFVADFPILRFTNNEIEKRPEWVANTIQGQIELIKGT